MKLSPPASPATSVNQEDAGSEFFQKFVLDIFPMSYPSAQALAEAPGARHSGDTGPRARSRRRLRRLGHRPGTGLPQRVTSPLVDWPGVIARHADNRRRVRPHRSLHASSKAISSSADFGTGHNLATLGHILHSEGEARSRALLRKVFEALAPGGTIAIAEFLVNADRTGPVNGLIFAVNMLVNTDVGDTYSFEEISGWLTDAGFADPRLLEAPGPSPAPLLATEPSNPATS